MSGRAAEDRLMVDLDGISVVPRPSRKQLGERQILDYRIEREHCLTWLLAMGKKPKLADGYAFVTVSNRASRMDQFNRWVWGQEERYTTGVKHEHADDYMHYLAYIEHSNAHKDCCQGSVPNYNDCTPEQRNRWRIYLSQRFEKLKSEVKPSD